MVRIHPDPPPRHQRGAIAQLGERLLCKQEVIGSIPIGSTSITSRGITKQSRVRVCLMLLRSRNTEASIGCSLTTWDRR